MALRPFGDSVFALGVQRWASGSRGHAFHIAGHVPIAQSVGRDVAYGVSQSVSPQVAVAAEDLSAGVTFIGFMVGVRQQVRLQVGALVEGATADGALVWRLLHVKDLVDGESPTLTESLAAFSTFERLLFAVDVSAIKKKRCIANAICIVIVVGMEFASLHGMRSI